MTEINSQKVSNSFGYINSKNSKEHALQICKLNDVRLQKIDQPARLLSGGNVQKLLIGKWLYRNPQIIIACQPTRGLDEGAIAAEIDEYFSNTTKTREHYNILDRVKYNDTYGNQ